MIGYIVESSLALILFYCFYRFLLAGENSYQFNRYYLVGTMALSFILPLMNFQWLVVPSDSFSFLVYPEVPPPIGEEEIPAKNSFSFYWVKLCWGIYFLGVIVKGVRFFKNLNFLFQQIKQAEKIKIKGYQIVLIPELSAPYSFFHYCFLDKKSYESGKIDEALFQHELTHIRQRHSIDILMTELVQILFWFNPILGWFKNAIKLNHEYLSDQVALQYHQDIISYQKLLFKYISAQNAIPLASTLHFSLTKKRFQMIQLHNLETKNQWKKILVVPLITLAFILFSFSLEGQTKPPPPPPVKAEPVPFAKSPTPPAPPVEANAQSPDISVPPPPPPVKEFIKKTPSLNELKKWEKSESYYVWLDGRRLKNSDLSKMKPEDFGWYHIASLAKNSKDYKMYQYAVSLFSIDYYNRHLSKDAREKYYMLKEKKKN